MFADDKGKICVYMKKSQRLITVSPEVDGLFNVDGIWSHAAENRMTRIEERFWRSVEASEFSSLELDQEAVCEFFALWRARVEFSKMYRSFQGPLAGITSRDLKGGVQR